MIGGDVETVRGEWGLRGEVAAFVDDSFQAPRPAVVSGSSLEAGVGIDRRAADYQLGATVLVRRERYDAPPAVPGVPAPGLLTGSDTDVSLVLSADRAFARERHRIRAFGVVNPGERSSFARAIWFLELRDNVTLESSAGLFIGSGTDTIGRFGDADFVYSRVKYFF
jgi:hypothetical protein